MDIEKPSKFIKDNKRQSYSSTRSKPLEYIYHNPILQSSKKQKQPRVPLPSSKEVSLKILDLKLPTIPAPKIISKFLKNYNKIFHAQKPHPRYKSLLSEYLHISNTSSMS